MPHWGRRSVLATSATLATGGLLASIGAGSAEEHRSVEEPDGWSSHHGNAGNTAHIPAGGAFPEPNTVAWEYDEYGDVAVVDGTVYLRTGTELHALDADDGEPLWTSDDLGADGTPAVTDDTVYVGGDRLTALEPSSGEVRWTAEFGSEGESGSEDEVRVPSPTVAYETVYVVVGETLYALDAADGSVRWSRDSATFETREGDRLEASFVSTPVAVANGAVYAGTGDTGSGESGFVALEATTGVTQWTHWEWTGADPHEYLVATADRVFTGDIRDGEEYPVLDATAGSRVGQTWFRFPLAVTDTVRVRVTRSGVDVYDYETKDGWSVGGATDQWGRPILVGETIIVPYHPGGREPELVGFDLETGTEQWSFPLTVIGMERPDAAMWPTFSYVVSGETIYATGYSHGKLTAIRASEEGDDEEQKDDADERIELSVTAPNSVPYEETAEPGEDAADFDITVANRGDETVSLEVALEIGPIDEPVVLELEAGECDTAHYGIMSRDLGVGEHDWTVTANGESESGTLTVTDGC